MGRICVVEKNAEIILSKITDWEIGILVGSCAGQRDYIVHVAKTPLDPGDRSGRLNNLKDLLVTSHATELNRLLPGGLSICGLVAIAPASELSSCQVKCQQLLMATYNKLVKTHSYTSLPEEWSLITMESASKKFTCKSLLVSDYKFLSKLQPTEVASLQSVLKPADVKFQAMLSGWLIAETSLYIDRMFYLTRQQQDQHFEQQLLAGLIPFLEKITNSKCLFNGKLMQTDDQLNGSESSVKGKRASTEGTPQHVNVQLLAKSKGESSSSCVEMVSRVRLQGTVSAIAFLRTPTTAAQVEQALKNDLKKSITLRCQLLCEDILQVGSEKHIEGQMIYETPPRVYIPLQYVPIVFTDYMFKDEKTSDCAERAAQLLGVEVDSSVIDTTVERSADGDDLKLLQTLREECDLNEDVSAAVKNHRSSFSSNLGRIASIASGAAIVLAVSLSYLNLDEWFG